VTGGNDFFGARYYSSSFGRFMSPDWSATADPVPYARLDDPQSLNLYAYVRNNPLSLVDRNGHSSDCGGVGDPSVVCVVTTVWDRFKSWFSGGGGDSHNTPVVSSRILPYGSVVAAVGHHYIPQQFAQDFNGATQKFSDEITTGPLADRTVNYFDALHRGYNEQVEDIILQYMKDTGKTVEDLSTSDIKAIVQRMKDAGGAIEEFNTRLTTANPEARSLEQALGNAEQAVGENPDVEEVLTDIGLLL